MIDRVESLKLLFPESSSIMRFAHVELLPLWPTIQMLSKKTVHSKSSQSVHLNSLISWENKAVRVSFQESISIEHIYILYNNIISYRARGKAKKKLSTLPTSFKSSSTTAGMEKK